MKVSELLQHVNTTKELDMWSFNLELLANDVGVNFGYVDSELLSEAALQISMYPILTWMCTDTEVGAYAYFLDGKIMCYTFQSARKNNIKIVWDSHEIAETFANMALKWARSNTLMMADSEDCPSWIEVVDNAK